MLIDNRKLIVRKTENGYEAAIRDYCMHWYDKRVKTGNSPYEAISNLVNDIKLDLILLKDDLDLAMYGGYEMEDEKQTKEAI